MHVNSFFKSIVNNRFAMGSGVVIVVLAIFLIASSFTKRSSRELRSTQANLNIRQIGHQLLLQSGDWTSRVLPVTEISEGSFLLAFENDFVLNHDSLMMLAERWLPKTQFPSGYTVIVNECNKVGIVYGFRLSTTAPNILACQGRTEPQGCYTIQFTFPDFYNTTFDYPFISLVSVGMLTLFCTGLLIGRFGKKLMPVFVYNRHRGMITSAAQVPALGKFLFDVHNQRLLSGSEVISLTDKECRILELLNENFGQLIPRETLIEKVWINEGVITGRSLDMFVSKLRKKLSADPELRITNVHGKGYKLEK